MCEARVPVLGILAFRICGFRILPSESLALKSVCGEFECRVLPVFEIPALTIYNRRAGSHIAFMHSSPQTLEIYSIRPPSRGICSTFSAICSIFSARSPPNPGISSTFSATKRPNPGICSIFSARSPPNPGICSTFSSARRPPNPGICSTKETPKTQNLQPLLNFQCLALKN